MQRLLIILGLVLVPFYEIFLKALPFVRSVAPDTRAPKEILALIFALSIGLLAVFNGQIKPFRNKFLLLIPIYLLFNIVMAPHYDMFVNNVESGDFFFWKPFSEVLCFTFMIIAIASIDIDIREIIKIMVICGTVMAVYVILQKLGLDQFWMTREGDQFVQVKGRVLGGNLGQPTLVASWMVMMIPLAFYLRKYWMSFLMIVACVLTQGSMVAMAIGLIFIISLFYFYKNLREPILILLIILSIFGSFLLFTNTSIRNKAINKMSGRSTTWKNIAEDIHNGTIDNVHKFAITGVGFGRFSLIFPDKHKSSFVQAHNDPLEFLYNCGIVGEYLLLAGIFTMIMFVCVNLNPLNFSILLSFIAILFCSLGSFPFQLGAHQFYSALLVGFLNNDLITRRI